jgi:hypothetical protein
MLYVWAAQRSKHEFASQAVEVEVLIDIYIGTNAFSHIRFAVHQGWPL